MRVFTDWVENFSACTPAETAKGPKQSILRSAEREREGRGFFLSLSSSLSPCLSVPCLAFSRRNATRRGDGSSVSGSRLRIPETDRKSVV